MAQRKLRNWWWVDFRIEGERYRVKSPHNSKEGAAAYENKLRLTHAGIKSPMFDTKAFKEIVASNLDKFPGNIELEIFAHRIIADILSASAMEEKRGTVLPNNKADTSRTPANCMDCSTKLDVGGTGPIPVRCATCKVRRKRSLKNKQYRVKVAGLSVNNCINCGVELEKHSGAGRPPMRCNSCREKVLQARHAPAPTVPAV